MAQTLKVGDIVEWRIRAQGADRCTRGEVIAIIEPGERPCDKWPRKLPQPNSRHLQGFGKPRSALHAIVREDLATGTFYRTPRIDAGLKLAQAPTKPTKPKKK